jgi:cell division protein FtsN
VDLITVQVASFRTRSRAEEVLAQVQGRTGLPGLVVSPPAEEGGWYGLFLGAFSSAEEAREAVNPLLRERVMTEVVLRRIEDAWRGALTAPPR